MSKDQHLFEIDIFCNITNVLTVTLKQFNEPPLNKSINSFKKLTDPKILTGNI